MLHEKQSRKCERRPAADFGAVAGLLQVPLLAVVFALLATVDEKKSSKFMFWFFFCCIILIHMQQSHHGLYNSCCQE